MEAVQPCFQKKGRSSVHGRVGKPWLWKDTYEGTEEGSVDGAEVRHFVDGRGGERCCTTAAVLAAMLDVVDDARW